MCLTWVNLFSVTKVWELFNYLQINISTTSFYDKLHLIITEVTFISLYSIKIICYNMTYTKLQKT